MAGQYPPPGGRSLRPHPLIFFSPVLDPRGVGELLSCENGQGSALRLSIRPALKPWESPLVAWAFFCSGFVTFVAAIAELSPSTLDELPHVAIAYPLAYVVGFLSVLTPGGLVVREGTLYLLLAPIVGKGNALVIALAMRAWEIAIEAACSAGVIGAHVGKRV